MKYSRIIVLVGLIIYSFLSISCKSVGENRESAPIAILPKIMNPTFKSYSFGTEKGYQVQFDVSSLDPQPTGVILFGIRTPIHTNDIHGNTIKINVIRQTQKIEGYTILKSELANGVLFSIGDTEYLKTTNFKKLK